MNDEEHNFYLTHIRFINEDIINNINQKEILKKNIKKNYSHSPNISFTPVLFPCPNLPIHNKLTLKGK